MEYVEIMDVNSKIGMLLDWITEIIYHGKKLQLM